MDSHNCENRCESCFRIGFVKVRMIRNGICISAIHISNPVIGFASCDLPSRILELAGFAFSGPMICTNLKDSQNLDSHANQIANPWIRRTLVNTLHYQPQVWIFSVQDAWEFLKIEKKTLVKKTIELSNWQIHTQKKKHTQHIAKALLYYSVK